MSAEETGAMGQAIDALCRQEPGVVASYLFGSRARGTEKPASDVDVAVLLTEESVAGFPFLDFKVALERILHRDVDLVVLNRADELLKQQVRCYGVVVHEKDHRERRRWELASRKSYEDYLHLHRIYMKVACSSIRRENGRQGNR